MAAAKRTSKKKRKSKRKPAQKATNPYGLSELRYRFVMLYALYGNGAKAYREAGYKSEAGNERIYASQLLTIPHIAAAVEAERQIIRDRMRMEADDVVAGLEAIVQFDPAETVDDTGEPIALHEMPTHVRLSIQGVTTFESTTFAGKGENQVVTQRTETRVTPNNRIEAYRMLGMHHGIFKKQAEADAAAVFSVLGPLISRLHSEEHVAPRGRPHQPIPRGSTRT